MENIFLSGVQFVSDNRFWLMPLICVVVWAGVIETLRTGFMGGK